MNVDIARKLAKAGPLPGPDLTLNARTGGAGPTVGAAPRILQHFGRGHIRAELGGGVRRGGDASTLIDGAIITGDQGVGQWSITGHQSGGAQWLTVSTREGEAEAQIDVDLADPVAVAHSANTLWGWATVGPAVF